MMLAKPGGLLQGDRVLTIYGFHIKTYSVGGPALGWHVARDAYVVALALWLSLPAKSP